MTLPPPLATTLPPALAVTLDAVADAMEGARAPWWIIGSAAIALHGAGPLAVADVDVLVDERDAPALLRRLGLEPLAGTQTAKFRSRIFARWQVPPLVVEIMADFDVAAGGRWVRVSPTTRMAIGRLFVPSKAELRDMLALFGRDKDRARAASLA